MDIGKIQQELRSGEIIKWSGKASPSAHVKSSLVIVLFAIPWTAFSVYWIAGASGFEMPDFSSAGGFFPLFGVPFLLIGIGMLLSPIFVYKKAKRTYYVITNKRAFEIRYGRNTVVKNYSPSNIDNIERKEKSDGSGNILFSSVTKKTKNGTAQYPVGFIGIRDVKLVEQYITALKAQNG